MKTHTIPILFVIFLCLSTLIPIVSADTNTTLKNSNIIGVVKVLTHTYDELPYVVIMSQSARKYMLEHNISEKKVMSDVDLGLNAPFNPFGTYFANALRNPLYMDLDSTGWGVADTCVKYEGTNPASYGWYTQIRNISKELHEGNLPNVKAYVFIHYVHGTQGGFIHDSMCVTKGKYFSISMNANELTDPMYILSPEELGTFTVPAIIGHEAFHGMTGDIYNSPSSRLTLMSMRSLYMDLPDAIRWLSEKKI